MLLNHISEKTGNFPIINSLLSEYGVLVLIMVYLPLASPNTLTIWRSPNLRIFSNGAQIMISISTFRQQRINGKLRMDWLCYCHMDTKARGRNIPARDWSGKFAICGARDNTVYCRCVHNQQICFHLLRRQRKENL